MADAPNFNLNETALTQGSFQGLAYCMTAAANATTEVDYPLDYDTDLLAGRYFNDECQAGDKVWFQVRVGAVGTLTANAAVSDTTLNVSASATGAAKVGHWISLATERGVGASQSEYLITAVDAGAGTLTILPADRTGGLDEAYTIGDYIYLVVKMVICRDENGYTDRVLCVPGHVFEFGLEKIGGSGVASGHRLRIGFENTHATLARTINMHVPGLY